MELFEKIHESARFIAQKTQNFKTEIGIILGTGLANLTNDIKVKYTIPYSDIPNFPVSTVKGHKGQLLFGDLQGKNVMVMQGRFHFYEGYTMQQLTFPVFVMNSLGIKKLLVSNASGGMNPSFSIGDIMLISDHINLMGSNPLIGPNDDRLGTRFPSMHQAYDTEFLQIAEQTAKDLNIKVKKGVYLAVTGPCFETPSEYTFFHKGGADAVGMSTVPEIIVANYLGMRPFGISVISDLGGFQEAVAVSHEEVIAAVEKTVPSLLCLVKEILARI